MANTVLIAVSVALGLSGAAYEFQHSPQPAPVRNEDAENAYANAKHAVATLRNSLRDPDSLVIERVYSERPVSAICLQYRAKNGFGGFNRATTVYLPPGILVSSSAVWNSHCLGEVYDVQL